MSLSTHLNTHILLFVVNGNWGHWGPWSSCSKTCEIGRMTRKRNCDNPKPQYGGNSCAGKTNETNPCQVEERCKYTIRLRCNNNEIM